VAKLGIAGIGLPAGIILLCPYLLGIIEGAYFLACWVARLGQEMFRFSYT